MSIVRYDTNIIEKMKNLIKVCCPNVQIEPRKDKLTVHARVNGSAAFHLLSNGISRCCGGCWSTTIYLLYVDIVIPGITTNDGCYSPQILRPHCSIYMKKEEKIKGDKSSGVYEFIELPPSFWAMNQRWFDENNFVDVLFGFREHGKSGDKDVVKDGDVNEMHYRPTRLFNASEVGCLLDKVIEFIRMWCDV